MRCSTKKIDDNAWVGFAPTVVFRGLEKPHLFDLRRDELYELDQEGLAFLGEVDGTRRAREIRNRKLLAFCRRENLLAFFRKPEPRRLARGLSPRPSLRYLEVQLTSRCNLACRHCYLGPAKPADLEPRRLYSVLDELDAMQGLRVLLSGGEPLLYPAFPELNERVLDYGFRSVLLTNGILLDQTLARGLRVPEVQISLDGMSAGHEALRGRGSFARAVKAARAVVEAGLDLSLATMVHRANLEEFDALEALVRELGAREWSIDAPCPAGRLGSRSRFRVAPAEGAAAMARAFGGSFHGSSEGFACGRHLATVMPDGSVAQCGFYADQPLGHLSESLRVCWSRRRHLPLRDLECADCEALKECGGGCRFRAGGLGKDPVMCALYGREQTSGVARGGAGLKPAPTKGSGLIRRGRETAGSDRPGDD